MTHAEKICSQLAEIWKEVPDCRLMELICNFQEHMTYDCSMMEDEYFLKNLESYIKIKGNKK